jgi:hypothetical protein
MLTIKISPETGFLASQHSLVYTVSTLEQEIGHVIPANLISG